MLLFPLLIAWLGLASAATHTYDWNLSWVYANPDGQAVRPVVGINGQWPLPLINITKGDRIVAKVFNDLGNSTASVHWHGLYHNGTNFMDGAPGVTQCEIPVGGSLTYNFTVDQAGSYWYHSHTMGQYPDGLRQALIVQDPESPHYGKYDAEAVITVSDWYHKLFPTLIESFISPENPDGAEPVPDAALLNDTSEFKMQVRPGKTYLIHFVNVAAFASHYIWIEGHTMRIVEVDGTWVEEAETDMIYIAAAQRYSVLVTMKDDASANFPIVGSMDTDLFDDMPDDLNYNVTGWLVYNPSASLPSASQVDEFNAYDDTLLTPTDGLTTYSAPDLTITLIMSMDNLPDGANYAFFNSISYRFPLVPTLYTVLSAPPDLVSNPTIYGDFTNSFILPHNAVVEIILNNDDDGGHGFHLHGHQFQVISRSEEDAGHFNGTYVNTPAVPVRRDTLQVEGNGHFVIRFRSDTPGVWLFHCHIEWHMATGLAATMIEAPEVLAEQTDVPEEFMDGCREMGTKTRGNAAGREGRREDWLDLRGQNGYVKGEEEEKGFWVQGVAAGMFSYISEFLKAAVGEWYGDSSTQQVMG